MTMTGRCLCGEVTFSAEEVETKFHACHCGMCRRWSGGAPFFATRVGKVTFAGGEVGRYDSSDWASRGFCKACGTTLFYFLKPAQAYMMGVGTFDDQQPFALHREIFIDKKPAGYALSGDHERWTEEETFARLAPP
jgi:hypothetical protein